MSGLQVGGLALIIGYKNNPYNMGKVVSIERYIESGVFDDGEAFYNRYVVVADDLIGTDGTPIDYLLARPKHLLPLGDKKTQDELAKEKELLNG